MVRNMHIHSRIPFVLAVVLCCSLLGSCQKTTSAPAARETAGADAEITVGSTRCDPSVQELTVVDADPSKLAQAIPLLPNLTELTLEGQIPHCEALLTLKAQFPDLKLVCPVPFAEKSASTDTALLDLSDTTVSMEELMAKLPLFFNLQELNLIGTELTDLEKMAVCDSLSGVFVLCELPLAGQYFLTDSEKIDLSGCLTTVEDLETMLPHFPKLQKLDLSFCGISDEEMDALNQRHPETNIVWTVTIGMVKVRTDAISFYPAGSNYYPANEEMKKLRYCTELIAIDIGHTRASDCEFLWYTPKVKYLILADTSITDITPVGNLRELIYLELFNLRIQDYSPLLNCRKLQDLNIGTTHADPEPLSKMTWLHNLQWHRADQDPHTKEAVLKLPEQLPDTNVVLFPKKKARNIGGPWRYLPNYYVFRDIIGAAYFNQDQIYDYWGDADGSRIMACEGGNASAADALAEILRERIDRRESIIGIKNIGSEKAEILYQTLLDAGTGIGKG